MDRQTDSQTEPRFEDFEDAEVKGKAFRLAGQKYLLTYKTHIDKLALESFLSSLRVPKRIYICHENGEGDNVTPYAHTHVVIDWGRAVDWKNARKLDFQGIHPHISKIKTQKQWLKACSYITKEDKSFQLHPEDVTNEFDRIWAFDDVRDCLREVGTLREARDIIAVHGLKRLDWGREIECAIEDYDMMYDWQKKIIRDRIYIRYYI